MRGLAIVTREVARREKFRCESKLSHYYCKLSHYYCKDESWLDNDRKQENGDKGRTIGRRKSS